MAQQTLSLSAANGMVLIGGASARFAIDNAREGEMANVWKKKETAYIWVGKITVQKTQRQTYALCMGLTD